MKRLLPFCLGAYALASLAHFIHNAESLGQYPNMPAWLSRQDVYIAWAGQTAIGLVGYSLYRSQHRAIGRFVLLLYGLLGLGGLAHYALAPMSMHTVAMNVTILVEVITAVALLLVLARPTSGAHKLNS